MKRKTRGALFAALLFILVAAIAVSFKKGILWDGAVYVGMGKFLFSHGLAGNWEMIRPPLLPIILGAFWKIGLDPYAIGTLLAILAGGGLVALSYKAGERVFPGSGFVAALLLGTTPIVIGYSLVPTTDVLSTLAAFTAVFALARSRSSAAEYRYLFLSGLFAGIAFLLRFPQGVVVVALGLFVLAMACMQQEKQVAFAWSRLWRIAAGFLIPTALYFVSSLIAYGDAFSPLVAASKIIGSYDYLYNKGFWYYFGALFKQEPLYIGIVVTLVLCFKKNFRSPMLISTGCALLVVGGYFLWQPHKELRYTIAFLPYLAVLGGAGITLVLHRFRIPKIVLALAVVICIAWFARDAIRDFVAQRGASGILSPEYATFVDSLAPGTRVLATNAYPLEASDARLVRSLYYDWSDAAVGYEMNKNKIDYVLLNSCDLARSCPDNTSCLDEKPHFLTTLDEAADLVFHQTFNSCEQWGYRMRR